LYHGKPVPRIRTGNWKTGYFSPTGTNDLIIFMNIGVPGTTGHDFDNKFDPDTNTIIWYGKPKTHLGQTTLKNFSQKSLLHISLLGGIQITQNLFI
jgi:hypothetical protein